MSVLHTLFSQFSSLIPTLGMALVHSLWQGGLIGMFTLMILRVCKEARWRYFWSCSALFLCLILPLHFLITTVFGSGLEQARPALLGAVELAPTQGALTSVATPPSALSLHRYIPDSVLPWLVCAWALGVAFMCLRMALGLRWVQGQVRLSEADSQSPESAAQIMLWQSKLTELARRAAVPALLLRGLRLRLSSVLESPVTAGCWRPVVILPTALLSGMPVELIEALLAHEVAHVKRLDYLVNLLQSAIEIILFYHPAVWWLSKQIRLEREQIADDIAAGLLGEPRRLALALSELERFQFIPPQLAQAAHGGNLMLRIQRLVRPDLASGKASALSIQSTRVWKTLLAICGVATASTVFYVQAQTLTEPKPAAKSAVANSQSASAQSARLSAQAAAISASEKSSQHRSDALKIATTKISPDMTSMGTNVDDDEITITENGRRYVIKDPQLVQQAKKAHQVINDLGEQMAAQGKKMEDQGQIMEEIGRKMEAITAPEMQIDPAFEKKLAAYEKKIAAYEKKLESLAKRRESAHTNKADKAMQDTQNVLQTQMRELTDLMKNLEQSTKLHEQKVRDAYAPMEEFNKKMNEASAPMESMSKEMEVLSKKMEIASKEVEKKMKDIIANAKQAQLLIPIEKS